MFRLPLGDVNAQLKECGYGLTLRLPVLRLLSAMALRCEAVALGVKRWRWGVMRCMGAFGPAFVVDIISWGV
jgi:hypothetical protein